MYGTKAAFDYITVGGRCAYETNKVFEFPAQPFYMRSCLYVTEHDNVLCTFMDTSSYVEILFGSQIESAKYYMLRLVYFAKNVNSLNLNITWKKEGDPSFCGECYEHVTTTISSNKFLHVDIDLRQNSEWVGDITNLRVGVYNTEIVPLFIRHLSVYSPTAYKCSKPACPYYSNYSTPCGAGKDLHILSGVVFEENSVNIVSNSSFSFTVYGIDFIVEIDNNNYFLNNILNEINKFFRTIPVPNLNINLDDSRIKFICNYTKPTIKHTEISEKLGFFDASGKDISIYTIENSGNSDYIDIAGNLKGVYKATNLKDLNFSKTFSIGFKDDGDMIPGSTFEFLDQTVIFHTLVVQFDGYINCFKIYCKALSGDGKILIFRRDGDIYTVVSSYNINETTYMEKQTIDWVCNVYKGDVIGIYNLKLYISKKAPDPINHYGVVSGYSSSINKTSIEDVSFSAVSLYAYFKQPTANDIPIIATYNEVAYVDRVSFLLKYDDSDLSFFNVIYNNTFSHEINGCQINVKDSLNVVTEVPGEVIGLGCLSNGVFFATEADSQLDTSNAIPPILLSSIEDRDVLRYSWAEIITDMYENNNYTYTFIAGDVFFYYEFPTTIDICKITLSSEVEEVVDNYLLKVLDNTKTSPSFSNVHDVIILDTQLKNWEFDVDGCISTKGIGVFVYNYGELPNISFAEIEFYTSVGSIPEYIIEVTATTYDNYVVPFSLDTNGTKNNVYVGSHIKNLIFNVGFITDNMLFDFSDINIYSSYVPDDYFVSESNSGEGTLKIYNTRSKALKCYLLDYNVDLLNNLIYEYDFDNSILHRGFVPTRYTHDVFYFTSSNCLNNKYITYALKNLINIEDFFITKSYNFNSQEYDDWYAPYDYLVPGYDGQFIYIGGGLTLKPLGSEAIRWFNYINTNEFYNDIDIELSFDYVGNMEDFVFIGITCCDRDYNNYLKFYGAFQFSPEYGLEFQLEGEPEPTYYKFAAILGRDAALKINKRGSSWTFSCFYSGEWHGLTTVSLFDTEILISISTLFNAPAVKGNVIAEFKSCNINASKIIHGKKVWYTINDGLSYVYGGCVLDNSIILDNISKSLTFPRECTVEKFIYDFNTLSTRYLKFVNTKLKSVKITEIKCYLDDVLIPIKQGFVSYSDDLFFGTLKGETDYLDDNVIINESLSELICKGADEVLSSVGVEFNSNVGVNKAVVYYIKETGSYEPLRVTYSYDNVYYYNVYDNFSLFSKTSNTSVHCLFNEFSGYKGTNEIIYDFVSNSQYSTDFSADGVQEYKWTIQSPYILDSGGVWLKNITGPESLYSKFSIDNDFIIDMYFDNFSNYSSGAAKVYLKVVFKNDTYYEDMYVYQAFDSNRVYTRDSNIVIESGRTSGGLRIKREGSVFYFYYRKYETTWYEVGSHDYGYDYIYPVDIYVYVSGSNSFDLRIRKVLITDGTGISDTDFLLVEAPSVNTLFVRGRQFSNTNTYAVAERWGITELSYPFSFSLLHCVNSSIAAGQFLIFKPYSFGLTYEEEALSLQWFSDYCTTLKIDNVLSYSAVINSVISLSVDCYNVDRNLFISQSDPKTKAIYKSRYDVNMLINETFKTGEGTFDKTHEDLNCQPGYLFDGFVTTSGGDERIANVCVTWNPVDKGAYIVLFNGNLSVSLNANVKDAVRATESRSSGKWYWEIKIDTLQEQCTGIGTSSALLSDYPGIDSNGYGYHKIGKKFHNNSLVNYGADYAAGDIIGVALDLDNGKIWFAKNNFWQASGDPVAGTNSAFSGLSETFFPMHGGYGISDDATARFFTEHQTYSPPSGFTALEEPFFVYDVEKVTGRTWVTCDTKSGVVRIHDDKLYFYFYNPTFPEHPTLNLLYDISGDFDIQTGFTICSGVDSDRCGLGLIFEIDDDNRAYIKAGYDSGEVFMCGTTVSGEVEGFNTSRTNSSGTLRVVRTNGNVTVYYKDGNDLNWTEFYVFSLFPTDVGRISLGLYSSTSVNPSGYFDNFILSTTKDASCQLGCLEDDFTGVDGFKANVDDWITYDTDHGSVRIQDNQLKFSFSV